MTCLPCLTNGRSSRPAGGEGDLFVLELCEFMTFDQEYVPNAGYERQLKRVLGSRELY